MSADCGSVFKARVGHQILQYQPSRFCGKIKTPFTQDAHHCVVMIVLSLFFLRKKPHTYTQPMGTSFLRGSLKENNGDLSSSNCGRRGNNKSGCAQESELRVWCQQRLNSDHERHNKTHLLSEKARNPKKRHISL